MSTFTFTLPNLVDTDQLRSELLTAGAPPISGAVREGSVVHVTFDGALVDISPSEIQAVISAHRPTDLDQFDQLVAKAVNVWAGTDTFTQAQAQKILAGLVITVARHLR